MNPAAASHREIERRFLGGAIPPEVLEIGTAAIEQGYIVKEPSVRLRRVADGRFYLTVKHGHFASHEEREIELTPEQFSELWPLTEGRRLHKIRRRIPCGDRVIELDSFFGPHEGLHIAEVEFPDEKSMWAFDAPAWFGREITGDLAYANVKLAIS